MCLFSLRRDSNSVMFIIFKVEGVCVGGKSFLLAFISCKVSVKHYNVICK